MFTNLLKVIVLFRKDELINDMAVNHHNHNAASLATFFKLYCNEETVKSGGDSAEVRDDAIRTVLDHSTQGMARECSGWVTESRRLEAEREKEEFGRVFNQVADFCYTIKRPDLVHDALQSIMRDEKWTSSTALVNVVSHQATRESMGNGAETWDTWYFNIEPAAPELMLTEHRLAQTPPVVTYKYVNNMWTTLDVIQANLVSGNSVFEGWKTKHLEELLHAVKSYDESDVEALALLAASVPSDTYLKL